ncbi:AtpZ/AtpI family protein [Pannonibacter sp. Pt2-lr]
MRAYGPFAATRGCQRGSSEISEADLSSRREKLNQLLEERRQSEIRAEAKASRSSTAGMAQAMKLSSEFIAGIVAGGMIGWLLDQWLGTMPIGLVVFILLGFGAGILNVLRSAGVVPEQGEAWRKPVTPGGKDEDSEGLRRILPESDLT